MEKSLNGNGPFLWTDLDAERTRRVSIGEVVANFWLGRGPEKVPHGLLHDWIAAVFIPGSDMQNLLAVIQDYDNHQNIYKPEVMKSRLIHRSGDNFQIYLRLLKKKVITVVLDTQHEVQYRSLDRDRCVCRSHTTRVAEVQNEGREDERVLPADTGHGFLWRLNSYWRFYERYGGVAMECRAISLTRDVPFGLAWAIEPVIQNLPRESLIHTLEATRRACSARKALGSGGGSKT